MSQIEVREADLSRPTDVAAMIEILDSYARDPMGGAKALSAAVRAELGPRLRDQPHALVFLADLERSAVGVAICFRGFSTFAARPLLNIHDLAVLPEARGKGVGRALLVAVEQRARSLDCCKLTLEVRQDNVRAHALYARIGFGDFAPGTQPTPTLFLEKRLQFN